MNEFNLMFLNYYLNDFCFAKQTTVIQVGMTELNNSSNFCWSKVLLITNAVGFNLVLLIMMFMVVRFAKELLQFLGLPRVKWGIRYLFLTKLFAVVEFSKVTFNFKDYYFFRPIVGLFVDHSINFSESIME